MSECTDCKGEAAIECCGKIMCQQCIGSHFMQLSPKKHQPMPFNSTADSKLTNAIHNKIANEILELEEFKTLAIQIINDFLQSIEKEVLEISELMNQMITEKCDQVEQDLKTTISHLLVKDIKTPILSLFKDCVSQDDIKKIKILNKNLSISPVNVGSVIKDAIKLSLFIESYEVPLITENTILTNNIQEKDEKSFLVSDSKTIERFDNNFLLNIDTKANRLRSQNFPKPLAPNIYNFVPLTNKILFYNPIDEVSNELLIDSHIFAPKAS